MASGAGGSSWPPMALASPCRRLTNILDILIDDMLCFLMSDSLRNPRKRPPSPGQQLAVAVLRAADAVRRTMTEAVEPSGLTLQQYNVLRILRGALPDPLPTLEIRDRLIERAPGITRFLDQLEERGLVSRVRSGSDRRQVQCAITDAGLELLAAMDEEVDASDESVSHGLSDREVRALLRKLNTLQQELDR